MLCQHLGPAATCVVTLCGIVPHWTKLRQFLLDPWTEFGMLELLEHFHFRDYAAQLLDLEVPAWVAHAADDPFIEYAIVEELVACLGKPRFHVLGEGGHNIQKTMAVELNQALKAWICEP